MKPTLLLLVTAFTFCLGARAQYGESFTLDAFQVESTSKGGFDPRYRGGGPSTSVVRLVKRADFVVLKVTVSSEAKKPDERMKELRKANEVLSKAAKREEIIFKTGYVAAALVARQDSLFSSGEKNEDTVASFNASLTLPLGEKDSALDLIEKLTQFAEATDLGKDIKVYFVAMELGLNDPDQYRNELLKMAAEDYANLKALFGPGFKAQFRGLDSRVQVRQIGLDSIEVSIPFGYVSISAGDDSADE